MGIFGKSAQQKRIDDDAVTIAELKAENARLLKEVADTGVLLTEANADIDRLERGATWASSEINRYAQMAGGFREERDALRAKLQPFLDRQEKAKANLRQYRGSNGVVGNTTDVTLNS